MIFKKNLNSCFKRVSKRIHIKVLAVKNFKKNFQKVQKALPSTNLVKKTIINLKNLKSKVILEVYEILSQAQVISILQVKIK